MNRTLLSILVLLALVTGGIPIHTVQASALLLPSITANTFDDPGGAACPDVCSLRAAVAEANAAPGNIIILPPGIYMLAPSNGPLAISADMTIDGQQSIVDGGGSVRIFNVMANLTVNDLTLRNGSSNYGGAIYLLGSGKTLTLQDVIFSGNKAGSGSGGAIDNIGGALVIRQSLFDGNTAAGGGGAIYNSGSTTSLTMENTTISGNRANGDGGGLLIGGGTVTLTNNTIANNAADADSLNGAGDNLGDGGGMAVTGGSVTVKNNLIATNLDGSGLFSNRYPDCSGAVISGGHNLLGINAGCGGLTNSTNGDKVGTIAAPLDLQISPLDYNGGPSRTHAVGTNSPAINAAAGCPAQDQRTATRPANCDIGAYEALTPFQVTSSRDTDDVNQGDGKCLDASGACTLRAAVEEANARPGLDEVVFAPSAGIVRATKGTFTVQDSLYIHTPGAVVEMANGGSLFFLLPNPAYLVVRGLTFRPAPGLLPYGQSFFHLYNPATILIDTVLDGGSLKMGDGPGIALSYGRLTIIRSTITHIHALGDGGGINALNGLVQMINSTVSDNASGSNGGGVAFNGGSSELRSTTITGNTAGYDNSTPSLGGGIALIQSAPGTRLRLSSTLIAGNHLGNGGTHDCYGTVISEGNNLLGSADFCSGIINGAKNDQAGTNQTPLDAKMSTLDYNGGLTPTHALLSTSPAIGKGSSLAVDSATTACPATDQRGASRKNKACDIGAYQAIPVLTVDDPGDTHDTDLTDGLCKDANGKCTLRAAIDQANADPDLAQIQITTGYPVVLTIPGTGDKANASGDLNLNSPVILSGTGPYSTVIDGGALDRVMSIANDATVTLKDLSLVNGKVVSDYIGGISIESTAVVMQHVLIQNNHATSASGGYGAGFASVGFVTMLNSRVIGNITSGQAVAAGGIANMGGLTMIRSEVSKNTTSSELTLETMSGGGILNWGALELYQSTVENNRFPGGYGAGIYNKSGSWADITGSLVAGNDGKSGAGIYNGGELHLTDSTVSGNLSTADGGGLLNAASATASLRNDTLTENTADSDNDGIGDGGGLLNGSQSVAGLANTILAGNRDPSLVNGVLSQDCAGTQPASLGYNLTGCGVLGGPGDLNIADPRLSPLQNNGGPTFTHAPMAGSPALKAGNYNLPGDAQPATCAHLDQRGALRPNKTLSCDIGAYQTVDSLVVNDAGDSHDAQPGDGKCADGNGKCTLRAAFEETSGLYYLWPIAVPAGLNTIQLSAAQPLAPGFDTLIHGPGAGLLTIDGGHASQVLSADHGISLLLSGMTLANGLTGALQPGGIVYDNADLTLQDVTISGGTSDRGAGIAVSPEGALTLENSAVINGVANRTGGGIMSYGRLVMNNVTVAGNTAQIDGGGLLVTGNSEATFDNVTLATNTADSDGNNSGRGGGISVQGLRTSVQIANSIVAGNADLTNNGPECSGSLVSLGYNLFGDPSGCLISSAVGDSTGQDPQLQPLGWYGGDTPVLPLTGSSPALDAGNPSPPKGLFPGCMSTDQIGTSRPQAFPGHDSARCDIGAYEAKALHLFLPAVLR